MNWLNLLLEQTSESEAPERYFYWAGLAAISAVVRKNIWINRHFYKLYPNVYIVLLSSRSGARKGVPISICKKLLEEVDLVRIISGCNSIQGMIQELGQQKTLENGIVIGEAHGILLSDEFDAFLTDDPKSLTYLTALYNTHEHEKGWEKTLKNSPKSFLKAPCLTMLVASNEILFENVVKRKDIEGGFIGRTALVRESKARGINSLVDPPEHLINFPELSVRLLEISKIKGEFKWTQESGKKYDKWYKDMMQSETDDRTGTYNRLGDQVLKVAMLISLARKDDLNLEWEDVELAIDKCEECADTATRISPSTESSNGDKPNAFKIVMDLIVASEVNGSKYKITKSTLLNKLQKYSLYTAQLDYCLNEYLKAGWITREMTLGSGNINLRTVYALTEEGARVYVRDKSKRFVN